MSTWFTLECPCCGDDAFAGVWVADGQVLQCGCKGWVSVSADPDDEPYVIADDCDCEDGEP